LEALIPTFRYPLPNAVDITKLLSGITENPDSTLINSVSGLSETEIELGLKLVHGITNIDEVKVKLLDYKQSRLNPLGLEFIPNPDVGDFGGMDRLKKAIDYVAIDYSHGARSHNIPYPKGWLLAGPPGTGKTFCAKVCATKLGFPLISVGVDVVKSRGAGYLKQLLQRIEAASPALCYFDEFDKFFDADTAVSGGSGTSKETLGVLLTWLQEKQTQTFVIATLNRLDALPPELTRAGRFDKIWYVGFPQAVERKEIFQLHASRFDKRYKSEHGPLTIPQWKMILNETNYCTGAEIRVIVEMGAKQRYYDDGVISLEMQDFIKARHLITPLYVRDTERVLAMENRAKGVAEPASEPDNSLFANISMNLWGEAV
jgi:SpoVK/Ycf46/Vps4 family AAA+-type ATPase